MDSWADVWEDEEEEEKEGECWGEEDGYLVIKYDKGGKSMCCVILTLEGKYSRL